MKQLTPTQLQAIQSLINSPSIQTIRIELFQNSLTHIQIISTIGAEFNLVDQAIQTLSEVMTLSYRGEPCHYQDDTQNVELYTLDWDGESLISLSMRSEGEPVVWSIEDILRREG